MLTIYYITLVKYNILWEKTNITGKNGRNIWKLIHYYFYLMSVTLLKNKKST